MEGFTPWELSTLKLIYHKFDAGRKGFLDLVDFVKLCQSFGVTNLSKEQFLTLYTALDLDGDSHISFDELLKFLSHSSTSTKKSYLSPSPPSLTEMEERLLTYKKNGGLSTDGFVPSTVSPEQELVSAMKLRAAMLSSKACLVAGAAVGMIPLLKSKIAIVLGTLFYDPIRLYRTFYVEYCTTLRSVFERDAALRAQTKHSVKEIMNELSFLQLFVAHMRLTRNVVSTLLWFVFSFALDSAVGVAMFLTYAQSRRYIVDHWRDYCVLNPKKTEFLSGACAGAMVGFLQGPARYIAQEHVALFRRKKPVVMSPPAAASSVEGEAVAAATSATKGAAAATVSSSSSTRFRWRTHVFPRLEEAIFRQSISHGAFFMSFYSCQHSIRDLMYQKYKIAERNSLNDAMATSMSGCVAGGVYRFASLPLARLFEYTQEKPGVQTFTTFLKRESARSKFKILTRGLGESLMWTMPTTGVAFLLYEAAFLYM